MKTGNFATLFFTFLTLFLMQTASAQKVDSHKHHCANGDCRLATPEGSVNAEKGTNRLYPAKQKLSVPSGCTNFACRNHRPVRADDRSPGSGVVTAAPALKMIFRQGG